MSISHYGHVGNTRASRVMVAMRGDILAVCVSACLDYLCIGNLAWGLRLNNGSRMSCEGLAGKFRRSTLLVVLVDGYYRWDWLLARVYKRLLEELAKLDVTVNEEKTRLVDLKEGGKFSFLGFDFQRKRTRSGKWGVLYTPRMKARTKLLHNLKDVFQRFISQPVERAIDIINPKLRGWVNYFRIGQSSRCFQYIKDWVEKKIRRHLMRARNRKGFGWDRWSRDWFYRNLGLYADYRVRPQRLESAASR